MIGRALALAALVAAPAVAQEVIGARAAQRLLFNERRAELVAHPQSSVDPRLTALLQDRRQVAGFIESVPYYGAIAVSPDQGLVQDAIVPVGNYHSFESAAGAALGQCNAQRPEGSRPCVIVAEIRPRGWRARALQLSAGATATFRREYRRGRDERAFAISPTSGGYGIGRGLGAAASAIAACNAAGGVADCRVAISD
ncbi:MAG: 5-aminolevulic acid synthase [Paracoccaceae bacterium]|nr:5-aminolevulic acid synthase [Paracoccaceae bacterium]